MLQQGFFFFSTSTNPTLVVIFGNWELGIGVGGGGGGGVIVKKIAA